MASRPKRRRKDTSIDARLIAAGERLDEWLRKMSLAFTKVRYYRARITTLERARRRPAREPVRGIRVEE